MQRLFRTGDRSHLHATLRRNIRAQLPDVLLVVHDEQIHGHGFLNDFHFFGYRHASRDLVFLPPACAWQYCFSLAGGMFGALR
jgi:hypothetical protein